MFNTSRNKISSSNVKVMQVCPRINCKKYCSLKLDSLHLSRLKAVWIPWLDGSSTDRYRSRFMKLKFSSFFFHPIHDYMFWLSSLTTLNIYKDYFKGRQRWHKLHKCWVKFCSCKLWPETKFALLHLSYDEVAVFVHRRVLWPMKFLIFIVWWTEELCNQQPSPSWWLKLHTGLRAIG